MNGFIQDLESFNRFVASVKESNPRFTPYSEYYSNVEAELAHYDATNTMPYNNISEIESKYRISILPDADEGYEIAPTIRSSFIRRIANKHGVLRIDNHLYQYHGDLVTVVDAELADNLTDLSTVPGAKVENYILNGTNSLKSRSLEGICNAEYRAGSGRGKPHRLKPRWYSEFVKIGQEKAGETWIEAKHQKKGSFGIWYANEEDKIRSYGHWNLFRGYGLSPDPTPVDVACHDCSTLEKVIGMMPTTDQYKKHTDWIVSGSYTTNTTEDAGTMRSCYISN